MSKLYNEIFKLKQELRKGWIEEGQRCIFGKDRVESDAEHIFSSCILALEIMEKENLKLDKLKVLKMLLYHEMGEIDFGDHTPQENIALYEKHENEKMCVEKIAKKCEMPEILTIWNEHEEHKTPESVFAYEMDKLDAIIQSKIYSKKSKTPEVYKKFYNYARDIAEKYKKYI